MILEIIMTDPLWGPIVRKVVLMLVAAAFVWFIERMPHLVEWAAKRLAVTNMMPRLAAFTAKLARAMEGFTLGVWRTGAYFPIVGIGGHLALYAYTRPTTPLSSNDLITGAVGDVGAVLGFGVGAAWLLLWYTLDRWQGSQQSN